MIKFLMFLKKEKKRKLLVNKKTSFNKAIVAGAFHGWLSIKKQQKIPKVLKKMQFPCFDALSYAHLAEGKIRYCTSMFK